MADLQILRRFALVTVIVYAAVAAITLILQALMQYEGGAGLGFVTVIVPAMEAGQTLARRSGAAQPGVRLWRLAGLFGLVSLVISAILALAASAFLDLSDMVQILRAQAAADIALYGAVVLALYILAARLFVGLGQRLELNRRGG